MRRRRFLATLSAGALAALAGCAGPNGSLSLTAVDDAAIAERYGTPVAEMPPDLREFTVAVIEDGPGNREDVRPPLDEDNPFEHEGAYYRFDHEVVATHTEVQYVIDADYDPDRPVEGATIAYADLPDVDQAALEDLLPPPEDSPTDEGYDLGRGHRYGPEAEEASVLVPEAEYDAVSYDGTAYPVRTERVREVDVHTYRYTAQQVATDAADLAATVRERYRFTLSDLSEHERDVVETAIEGSYRVESDDDPPEAFEALLERFRSQEAVRRDEYGGDWLVRYEGEEYWVDVGFPRQGTTPDEETPPATPPEE